MFARIYPIVRLPRRFVFFDYAVPPTMHVDVGDIVRMTLRNRFVLGIVASLSDSTDVRGTLHNVESIFWKGALCVDDIVRIEKLAASIVQSPSTVFFSAFGTLYGDTQSPKNTQRSTHAITLQRDVAEQVKETMQRLRVGQKMDDRSRFDKPEHAKNLGVQISHEGALAIARLLAQRCSEQVLVIVPRERDAELAAHIIHDNSSLAILHGTTKPRERERILRAWQNGSVHTLIGTRQASLIPAKKIGAVVVLSCGIRDHWNERRNPRFDSRNAAWLLATQHEAHFIACDVLPRPEEYAAMDACIFASPQATPHIVDLRSRDVHGDEPLLSVPLITAIENALQRNKNVLIFYNRKGIAHRAQCRNCGVIVRCVCENIFGAVKEGLLCGRCGATRSMPDFCEECKDGIVSLRGIGNVHIEASLNKLFPNINIARVEKGSQKSNARIQLVTEYFFSSVIEPFAKKTFGLVADLAVDLSMRPENFRSNEETCRNLHRLMALAHTQGAELLVQTWLAEDVARMCNAKVFLENEIALRTRYGLPPSRVRITVRHADVDALAALTGAHVASTTDDTVEIRISPLELFTFSGKAGPLSSLPDTSVLSVDQSYDITHRSPQSKS